MHASIIPVLARLRQDVGEILKPEVIREACRHAGYSWRNRKLDPVTTVSMFLLQILHGNTACQHVVQFGRRVAGVFDPVLCLGPGRLGANAPATRPRVSTGTLLIINPVT